MLFRAGRRRPPDPTHCAGSRAPDGGDLLYSGRTGELRRRNVGDQPRICARGIITSWREHLLRARCARPHRQSVAVQAAKEHLCPRLGWTAGARKINVRLMSFVEVAGLSSLLKAWRKKPGAPAKELSRWSQHSDRNEPFTPEEIEEFRRTLTALAPTLSRDIFEEQSESR